jgi:hypothetical protein
MIPNNSVFILGAGASAHLGFPNNRELKKRITEHVEDSSSSLFKKLRQNGHDDKEIAGFAHDMRRSIHTRETMDVFLATRTDYCGIGAYSVAYELRGFEDEAKLFSSDTPNWYKILYKELKLDHPPDTWNRVPIVTFNYERSLEAYLNGTVEANNTPSGRRDEKIRALQSYPIYHVYGSFGSLAELRYSPPSENENLNSAAANLRFMFQSFDNEDVRQARKKIDDAEHIIFLGFGYDQRNVQQLGLNPTSDAQHRFHGTAFEIHGHNKSIRDQALALFSGKINVPANNTDSNISTFLEQWLPTKLGK